jgi:hypothetical protein
MNESQHSDASRVVAHMNDGRILRGATQDFFPNRAMFHLIAADGGATLELRTKELKGLFFVRAFGGNPTRKDVRGFIAGPQETSQGKKIAVLFKDGELLCGYSLSFMPDREGFFLFPADKGSNNVRVYVVMKSTKEVKAGPMADALATRLLAERGES